MTQWIPSRYWPVLVVVLSLATVGTVVLFGVGLSAYVQRRSRRYLLVAGVLALLVGRTFVGMGTLFGVVPMGLHHLIAHSIDFLTAATLLYLVYQSPEDAS
ncbi:uncharacterized protein HHUB_4042 (plasmid) [Halobacterium hubeiense]|uniref:Uncharacterized protein n=1 Tax=Halobacterium hubeiense TaxID=1407499 RepID=A0A0U5H5H4_9EURY|nr:hypothetical protein [Halobacterium hubeiense]CQH63319.1 uncharacterized protein HHUB_4042 [Halobacterium hubeiense]